MAKQTREARTRELGEAMIEETLATFYKFLYQAAESEEFDDKIFLASFSALICVLMEIAVKQVNMMGPETNGKILLDVIVRRVLDNLE